MTTATCAAVQRTHPTRYQQEQQLQRRSPRPLPSRHQRQFLELLTPSLLPKQGRRPPVVTPPSLRLKQDHQPQLTARIQPRWPPPLLTLHPCSTKAADTSAVP